MPKQRKSVLHLAHYHREDLAKKGQMRRRSWLHTNRTECGKPLSRNVVNAVTRKYVTCLSCKRAYDAWYESVLGTDADVKLKAKFMHLHRTNMDPESESIPF